MSAPEPLVASVKAGDPKSIARAITLTADGGPDGRRLRRDLALSGRRAHRIGITGPPGAGKSTLIGGLLRLLRARGESVGVIACDPASPLTGGAFLGDRMRMWSGDMTDPGIFIRSLSTRGPGAQLPEAALAAAEVLEAAGFNRVILETPGAGQNDAALSGSVDTAVLVLSPDSGDGYQVLKAGFVETADVLVVNRADRPGAEALASELAEEVAARASARPAAVVLTVATVGEGLDELLAALDAHRAARSGKEPV